MNSIILTVLTALVLALIAAAVGPAFVDWSAHRATIETYLEEAIGAEVTLSGEADIRLLPTPRVQLSDVAIGEPDAPFLSAETVELAIELIPLVSGEVRVVRLALGAPTVKARLDANGAIVLPEQVRAPAFTSFFDLDAVVVEDVSVERGTLVVRDGRTGAVQSVRALTLDGSARSLRGPFEAAGTARLGETPVRLTLQGGALQDDGAMALSGSLAPVEGLATLRFDGEFAPSEAAPQLSGTLTVASGGAAPFTVRGRLDVDAERALLSRGALSFGPTLTPVEMSLDALATFTDDGPIALSLSARQIDLDTLARNAGDADPDTPPTATPAPLALAKLMEALGAMASTLAEVPTAEVEATAELSVAAILAGGAVIEDVRAAVSVSGNGIILEDAEALLPGDTTLLVNGRTLTDGIVGWLRVEANRPALLARWWGGGADLGTRVGPVFVEADFALEDNAILARRLSVDLDRSSLAGRLRYEPQGEDGPLLAVLFDAPRLDVAEIVQLAGLTREALGPLPSAERLPAIILDVSADELRLGPVTGSYLAVDADYRGGTLTIDALNADDLAGALVFAEGQIAGLDGQPVGSIRGTLDIADGARTASALSAVLPAHPITARFTEMLPALTPAALDFSMSGDAPPDADTTDGTQETADPTSLTLSVSGAAGDLSVDVAVAGLRAGSEWRSAPLTMRADVAAEDGPGALLALLTVPDERLPANGRAAVSAAIEGRPADGFEATIDATWDDDDRRLADLSYRGALPLAPEGGALSLSLADAAVLSDAFPVGDLGAVALEAVLRRGADGALAVSDVTGTVDGQEVTGALTVADAGVRGAFTSERLDGDAILALALGADALFPEGSQGISDAPFPPPNLPQRPVELAIETDRLTLMGAPWRNATLTLRAGPGQLDIDAFRAENGAQTLSGRVEIDRTATRASVSSDFALDGVALSAGAGGASAAAIAGTLEIEAEGRASGGSLAELVASVTGTANVRLREGTLTGVPLGPLPLGFATQEGAVTSPEAVEDAVTGALAALRRDVPAATLDFEAAGGILRLVEAQADGVPVETIDTLSLSLPDRSAALVLSVPPALKTPLEAESDAPPPLTARYSGPWDALEREVDASALTAWISLRQLESQIDQVEAENEELEAESEGLPNLAPLRQEETAPPADTSADDEAASVPNTGAPTPSAADADLDAAAAGTAPAPSATPDPAADELSADAIGEMLRRGEVREPAPPRTADGPDAPRAFDMRASDLVPVR